MVAEDNKIGLSAIYGTNKTGSFKYFTPTTVGGQPGVFASTIDERAKGSCQLSVGLSDRLMIGFILRQAPDKVSVAEPCGVASDVAGLVIQTIKAG